jgi:hypothetical protein
MWGVTLSLLFLSRTHTKTKKMENRYRSGDGSITSPIIMDNNNINSINISHPNNQTSSINNNNNINFYTTNRDDNDIDNPQNEPLLRNNILNDVEVAFNNGINNVNSSSSGGYNGAGMFGHAGVPYGSPYIGGGDTPSSSSRSANHSIVHSIIGPSSQRSYSVASTSTHINHNSFIGGMSNVVGGGGGGGVMNKKSFSEYSNYDTIETISNIDDDNDENYIGDVDHVDDDMNVSKQSDNELFGVVYSPENSSSFYYRNSSNSFNHSINPSVNTTSTTANNINNNIQNNSEKSSSIQTLDNDNIKSLFSGYNQGHSK